MKTDTDCFGEIFLKEVLGYSKKRKVSNNIRNSDCNLFVVYFAYNLLGGTAMRSFLDENFLLTNPTAVRLYYEFASQMPIYDYHCHIDAKEIYEDRRFKNLTELWLGGDHYKWRLMRSNGVPEEYITGDRPDREKFQKFAETLPRAIGNPMYHWCHLELKNYFGYTGILNGDTAQQVWEIAEKKLKDPAFSTQNLIARSNVAMIGTTDDPCSDLRYHKLLAQTEFKTRVCPSFRPDPYLNPHKPGFCAAIDRLEQVSGKKLDSIQAVAAALSDRMEYFNELGCRAADHGLDYVMYRNMPEADIDRAFCAARASKTISLEEREAYQTFLLLHCGREYHRLGWAMQLHFSCMRSPNSRMVAALGPDSGFDCIAVSDSCQPLFNLMDTWDREQSLPKTILYSLNPADNQWLDSLIGAFQGPETPGKIQHGSAWWFNDHKIGMQDQLCSLANLGILGNFVGMLTDSRSFLSYSRHEYFRRILCNVIGTWIENGEYPMDFQTVGGLIQDICSRNAKRYFNL